MARAGLGLGFFVLDGLVLFGILTVGLWSMAGARPLPALIAAGKEEEAGRAFRMLLLAGVAFAAAMMLSDRALLAASIRRPLSYMSGESVDMSQRLTILKVEAAPAMRGRPVLMVLDAVGCLAVFAAPLIAARGVKKKVSIGGVIAGVAAAITALLALVGTSSLDRATAALRTPYEDLDKALATNAITVPTKQQPADDESSGTEQLPRKSDLLVKKDGSVVEPYTGHESRVEIAADASATFEAFMAGAGAPLLKGRETSKIGFTLLPEKRVDFASLGGAAGYMGTDLASLPVNLHGKFSVGMPSPSSDRSSSYGYGSRKQGTGVLAVLPDGDVGRLVAVTSPTVMVKLAETLPLGSDTSAKEARRRILTSLRGARLNPGMLALAPLPGDTIGRITAQLQTLSGTIGSTSRKYGSYGDDTSTLDLVLTADRATLEAAPALSDVAPATTTAPTTRPSPGPTRRRPGR